jgi:hypothetical protein
MTNGLDTSLRWYGYWENGSGKTMSILCDEQVLHKKDSTEGVKRENNSPP